MKTRIVTITAIPLVLACSCARMEGEKKMAEKTRPNVILISLDSCRPDHLSCYGYFRETSPNMDRFAAEGVRFENAFSVAGWTLPTHTSMLTGLDPRTHGLLTFGDANRRIPGTAPSLTRALREAGYATGAFIGENVVFGFPAPTRQFFETAKFNVGKSDGASMKPLVETLLMWIDGDATTTLTRDVSKPFFAYVHTNDIHSRGFFPDYSTAPEFLGKWTKDPNTRLLGLTPEEREKIKAQYDGCISFVDHYLGVLFEGLKQRGIYDNTLVIIVSDHGDLHWDQEGESWGHGYLYDSTLRVVALMRWPTKLPRGKVVRALASQTDLPLTILDLLGMPPFPDSDGVSLVPVIKERKKEVRPAMYAGPYSGQTVIRTHDWKYMKCQLPASDDKKGPKPFLLKRAPKGEELYDLKADPGEKRNVAEEYPEIAKRLRSDLEKWEAECRARAARLGIPTK